MNCNCDSASIFISRESHFHVMHITRMEPSVRNCAWNIVTLTLPHCFAVTLTLPHCFTIWGYVLCIHICTINYTSFTSTCVTLYFSKAPQPPCLLDLFNLSQNKLSSTGNPTNRLIINS